MFLILFQLLYLGNTIIYLVLCGNRAWPVLKTSNETYRIIPSLGEVQASPLLKVQGFTHWSFFGSQHPILILHCRQTGHLTWAIYFYKLLNFGYTFFFLVGLALLGEGSFGYQKESERLVVSIFFLAKERLSRNLLVASWIL